MIYIKYIFTIRLYLIILSPLIDSVWGMEGDDLPFPMSKEAERICAKMLKELPSYKPKYYKSHYQDKLEESLNKILSEEGLKEKTDIFREVVSHITNEMKTSDKHQGYGDGLLGYLSTQFLLSTKKRALSKIEFQGESKKHKIADIDLPLIIFKTNPLEDIPPPKVIYENLSQSTKGQDAPLKQLSTLIYRFLGIKAVENTQLYASKPTIVLVGPTGCGKTSTLDHLAKFIDAPLVVAKATEWTPQGYIGKKWQDMFTDVIEQGFRHAEKKNPSCLEKDKIKSCENAIIFIDEFDKLAGNELGNKEAAFFKRVQSELLPVIEGGIVIASDKSEKKSYSLKTHNMLFIVGGAFSGMKPNYGETLVPQDLNDYGITKEMSGRLRNIITLNPLSKEAMVSILKESKTSPYLAQIDLYKTLYGVDLEIEEDGLNVIAEKALEMGTGARALGGAIDHLLKPYEFDISSYLGKKLALTGKDVQQALKDYGIVPKNKNDSHLTMYI